MKASLCIKSGSPEVIKVSEVKNPIPKSDEILVKIYASTVTSGDVKLRKIPRFILLPIGILFGFKAMKITGVEFAGVIEEIGENVNHFKIGDKVFGTATGLAFGGNAEYVCIPEKRENGVMAKMPVNISFSEAASIPVGAMTALHILKKANITEGKKVLIYGASGSVGTFAIQIAKYFGANVTAVCSSNNLDVVKSIGADITIDYTKNDFAQNGLKYDVIFDAVGKISKSYCKKSLNADGKYLTVKYPTSEKNEYMDLLKELVEKGKLKSVIDRFYKLDQIVEAHKYVEMGHKKGNVVIEILSNNV